MAALGDISTQVEISELQYSMTISEDAPVPPDPPDTVGQLFPAPDPS